MCIKLGSSVLVIPNTVESNFQSWLSYSRTTLCNLLGLSICSKVHQYFEYDNKVQGS